MSLSDLASIGSLISGIAVLASLIYLSQQIRQSSKHTQALISQGRTDHALRYNEVLATNPELLEIVMRGSAGDETLAPLELARFRLSLANAFLSLEDEFRQHRAGLIDDNRHAGFVQRIARNLRQPGSRALWKMQRFGFDTDFQSFIDEIIHKAQSEPTQPFDQLSAWKLALDGEQVAAN